MPKLITHDRYKYLDPQIADFIEEIEYMQSLYSNARYTQAEAIRDKLAEQLDDLMRLGRNDH